MTAGLHSDVTALYARQSHAIDGGDADGWAGSFTVDGEFSSPTHGEPARGRAALTQLARGIHERNRAAGVQERHWLNSLVVGEGETGPSAQAYLLIVRIAAHGRPELARHVVIRDELRYEDGGVRVARRQVRVDGG